MYTPATALEAGKRYTCIQELAAVSGKTLAGTPILTANADSFVLDNFGTARLVGRVTFPVMLTRLIESSATQWLLKSD